MQGTVHLLVGAAIAVLFPHTPTAVVLAFFSHYALDALPHIDPETFADGKAPYNVKQRVGLIVDVVLVLTLLAALYIIRNQPAHILIGAIAAQAPDLLLPLERYDAFAPLRRLHFMLHWNESWAQERLWYFIGIFTPISVAIISLFIIWNF